MKTKWTRNKMKNYFWLRLVDQGVRLKDENNSGQKSDSGKRSDQVAPILEEEVTENHHNH